MNMNVVNEICSWIKLCIYNSTSILPPGYATRKIQAVTIIYLSPTTMMSKPLVYLVCTHCNLFLKQQTLQGNREI